MPPQVRPFLHSSGPIHAAIARIAADPACYSRGRAVRWGFGWGLIDRIKTADDAREVLAVFSMKDGDHDYRDQIVAHDHLCAALLRAGLPIVPLLTEAAAWSSDIARFPPARSTRALLEEYARRFTSP